MLLASLIVLVTGVLVVGVLWERNKRRELAAAYDKAGYDHAKSDDEPGMIHCGYARTYGYVGGSFGEPGGYGASSGGERTGSSNSGDSN